MSSSEDPLMTTAIDRQVGVATTGSDDERFLTRREAEVILENGRVAYDAANAAHLREHEHEAEALKVALAAAAREYELHMSAHDMAHLAHERIHQHEASAREAAVERIDSERDIHTSAHERDHAGHMREHELDKLAITKAEGSTDLRFKAADAFREQLDVLVRTLASKEAVEGYQKRLDQRLDEMRSAAQQFYEANRLRIEQLEKGDVKQEGKGIGQGAVIAAIITGVGLAATVLGIVVILINLTKTAA